MAKRLYSIITGTGSYVPKKVIKNSYFEKNEFYDEKRQKIEKPIKDTIDSLYEITGIKERRYAPDKLQTSHMGYIAAKKAIDAAQIDKETLDLIIFTHNFGDLVPGMNRIDQMPTMASRVKKRLKIENPYCVAKDIIFGCPGWIEGLIHANDLIQLGKIKKALVIAGETLSRISDPHDRDTMIYADGAGAAVIEATMSNKPVGVLSDVTVTHTLIEAFYLYMEESYNPGYQQPDLFMKMKGKKIYLYALQNVPKIVKESLDKAGLKFSHVKKLLIHQANEKMDRKILDKLFNLYNHKKETTIFHKITDPVKQPEKVSYDVMPMTISYLGNNSAATVPVLLDLLYRKKLNGHSVHSGDVLVFAAVGAGMSINSVVYKLP
ncbi:MAG: ketoacyl-ACP synthase III [Spirochaetales bacterium]|nr:ketoacyl-ACP synthase III [Spirochaetales bacterium]